MNGTYEEVFLVFLVVPVEDPLSAKLADTDQSPIPNVPGEDEEVYELLDGRDTYLSSPLLSIVGFIAFT